MNIKEIVFWGTIFLGAVAIKTVHLYEEVIQSFQYPTLGALLVLVAAMSANNKLQTPLDPILIAITVVLAAMCISRHVDRKLKEKQFMIKQPGNTKQGFVGPNQELKDKIEMHANPTVEQKIAFCRTQSRTKGQDSLITGRTTETTGHTSVVT